MYSSIEAISKKVNQVELIKLVNDENRSEVDLTNPDDLCVIRINEIIAETDEFIDGYISGKYNLPLSIAPKVIKKISTELSLIELKKRRLGDNFPESLDKERIYLLKMLKDIQTGILKLAEIKESEDEISGKGSFVQTSKTKEDRLFSKDLLNRY